MVGWKAYEGQLDDSVSPSATHRSSVTQSGDNDEPVLNTSVPLQQTYLDLTKAIILLVASSSSFQVLSTCRQQSLRTLMEYWKMSALP